MGDRAQKSKGASLHSPRGSITEVSPATSPTILNTDNSNGAVHGGSPVTGSSVSPVTDKQKQFQKPIKVKTASIGLPVKGVSTRPVDGSINVNTVPAAPATEPSSTAVSTLGKFYALTPEQRLSLYKINLAECLTYSYNETGSDYKEGAKLVFGTPEAESCIDALIKYLDQLEQRPFVVRVPGKTLFIATHGDLKAGEGIITGTVTRKIWWKTVDKRNHHANMVFRKVTKEHGIDGHPVDCTDAEWDATIYNRLLEITTSKPGSSNDYLTILHDNRHDAPRSTSAVHASTLAVRAGSQDRPLLQVQTSQAIVPRAEMALPDFLSKLLASKGADFEAWSVWAPILANAIRGLKVKRSYPLRRAEQPISSVIGFGLPPDQQLFTLNSLSDTRPEVISVKKFFQELGPKRSIKHPKLATVNIGKEDKPIWIPMELLIVTHQQSLPKHLVDFIGGFDEVAKQQWADWIASGIQTHANQSQELSVVAGLRTQEAQDTFPAAISQAALEFTITPLDKPAVNTDHIDLDKGTWKIDPVTKALPFKTFASFDKDSNESPIVLWYGAGVSAHAPDLKIKLNELFIHLRRLLNGANMRLRQETIGVDHLPYHPPCAADIVSTLGKQYPRRTAATPVLLITNELAKADAAIFHRALDFAGVRAVIFNLTRKGKEGNYKDHSTTSELQISFPCQELALKLNALTNTGENFAMTGHEQLRRTTMVVGATITRPGSDASKDCPAIASVVAASDSAWTRFPGTLRLQKSTQTEIASLESMMVEMFTRWKQASGNQPLKRVLLYRAGVGQKEYLKVQNLEITMIEHAYSSVYGTGSKAPEVTIVVTEKDHTARFAPSATDKDGTLLTDRLKAGSVIDIPQLDNGCRQFYLQSHSNAAQNKAAQDNASQKDSKKETNGINGAKITNGTDSVNGTTSTTPPSTAHQSPSRTPHYFITHNPPTDPLPTPLLKYLTYTLCWTTPHSTNVLTYPGPISLAEKLAARGRAYLHEVWSGRARVHDIPGKFWPLAEGAKRKVPWGRELDDVMFYI